MLLKFKEMWPSQLLGITNDTLGYVTFTNCCQWIDHIISLMLMIAKNKCYGYFNLHVTYETEDWSD